MDAPAQYYEKGPCLRCRNHYRDKGSRLHCVAFQGRIPQEILTGDRDCREFKPRER